MNDRMTDVGKFVVFKPVAGGYVYRRPTAWLFGSSKHFLVTEAQKAAILAVLAAATRSVLWVAGLTWLALSALLATALTLWAYRSGHYVRGLDGISVLVAMMLSVYPAFVASRQAMLRRLRPILAMLAPTNERITSREERDAIRAIAHAAPPAALSPARRRIIMIAGSLAMVGTLGIMIARAIDTYDASHSKLLTLYLANANPHGLFNVVTILALGFMLASFQRSARRQ
jgi:hypothetical protein